MSVTTGVSRGDLAAPALSLHAGIALLATTIVFWVLAGLAGLVGGLVLGVATLALPRVFVFALGQLLVATFLPSDPAVMTLVLSEIPLVGLQFSDSSGQPLVSLSTLTTLVVGGGSLLAGALVVRTVSPLWMSAALIIGLVAIVSYGIHRYTLVTLGVVPNEQ